MPRRIGPDPAASTPGVMRFQFRHPNSAITSTDASLASSVSPYCDEISPFTVCIWASDEITPLHTTNPALAKAIGENVRTSSDT